MPIETPYARMDTPGLLTTVLLSAVVFTTTTDNFSLLRYGIPEAEEYFDQEHPDEEVQVKNAIPLEQEVLVKATITDPKTLESYEDEVIVADKSALDFNSNNAPYLEGGKRRLILDLLSYRTY